MSNNSSNSGAGISFCGFLAIAFIVLKLIGKIDWSWLWVLAPLWIPLAIGIVAMIVIAIIYICKR